MITHMIAALFAAVPIAADAPRVVETAPLAITAVAGRDTAYLLVQRSDLRNLAVRQEVHYSRGQADGEHAYTYSTDLDALAFVPSDGVTLRVTFASHEGWAAVTVHEAGPRGCVMYVGVVDELPATDSGMTAARPGIVLCDPPDTR